MMRAVLSCLMHQIRVAVAQVVPQHLLPHKRIIISALHGSTVTHDSR